MQYNQRDEAKRIIEEIKHELALLKADTVGWTQVDYPHAYKSRYDAIDIELWAIDNCGDFKKSGRTFYFRDAKDASMFLLKWT